MENPKLDDAATDDADDIKRRSARAMAATYVQVVRHAELAQALQAARIRSTERRLQRTKNPKDVARLTRQLDAQQHQGANIQGAVARFRQRAQNAAAFKESGLTPEDFREIGLERLVEPETIGDTQKAADSSTAESSAAARPRRTGSSASAQADDPNVSVEEMDFVVTPDGDLADPPEPETTALPENDESGNRPE